MFMVRSKDFRQKVASVAIICSWTGSMRYPAFHRPNAMIASRSHAFSRVSWSLLRSCSVARHIVGPLFFSLLMARRTSNIFDNGFFIGGEKQSYWHSIFTAPECAWYCFSEKLRLLPFSLLIAIGPFWRHGPPWRIADLRSLGHVPSWKRTRSVGLSSVRYNSWTTGPRGAGSAAALCRGCNVKRIAMSEFYSFRPPHCPVYASFLGFCRTGGIDLQARR